MIKGLEVYLFIDTFDLLLQIICKYLFDLYLFTIMEDYSEVELVVLLLLLELITVIITASSFNAASIKFVTIFALE